MAGCAESIGANIVQSPISRFFDFELYSLVFWLIGMLPLAAPLLMLTVLIHKLKHPGTDDSPNNVAGSTADGAIPSPNSQIGATLA